MLFATLCTLASCVLSSCVTEHLFFFVHRKLVKTEPVIEYYSGRKELPIYTRQKKHLSTTQIVETLLDPDLDQAQICKTQPVGVESNLAFIVDLKHLKNPKDILCDELGSWKCNGCHHTWVVVDEFGIADVCGKKKPSDKDGALYRVTKKYYNNKGSPDFNRMVVFLEGMCASKLHIIKFAVVMTLC